MKSAKGNGVRTVTASHTLESSTTSYMDKRIVEDLLEKLTDMWLKEYSAQLLKELAPKKMSELLKKNIEDRLSERFLK